LSHPLVLIAVGAVVSGLLVPALTRGAQNHRQALEIKSDLVTSMSGAASPFLAATLANLLVYHGEIPRSYDLAYERWFARSSDVGTKLRTYYPDGDATGRWSTFSLRMRDLYYYFRLSSADDIRSIVRADYVGRLKLFLAGVSTCSSGGGGGCPNVDFKSIDSWLAAHGRRFDDFIDFYFEELLQAFKVELNDIVDATLRANPRL
jgi:hypothetical protein